MADRGTPATPGAANAGRGQGAGGHGGRGGCGGSYNRSPRVAKFEGRCSELRGHIFDCQGIGQADRFSKTKKEIKTYVGTTFKQPGDIVKAIDDLRAPTISLPTDPGTNAAPILLAIFKEEISQFVKKKSQLATNLQALYSLVVGQCTEGMLAKVEAEPDFINIAKPVQHGIELLKIIKKICYNFSSQKNVVQGVHEAVRSFYMLRQENMSVVAYYEAFLNKVDILTQVGATIGPHKNNVVEYVQGNPDPLVAASTAEKADAKEQSLAMAFIMGCNRNRFKELIIDYENAPVITGTSNWPKTVNDAYFVLSTWKSKTGNAPIASSDGVVFNQQGDEEGNMLVNSDAKSNARKGAPRDISTVKCHRCKKLGHYANTCTEPKYVPKDKDNAEDEEGANMLISAVEDGEFHGYVFSQDCSTNLDNIGRNGNIPNSWVLLDNQSTVDVFSNAALLQNIRETKGTLTIHCNAGSATTNLVGEFDRYGTVWYHPGGIANVLSLAKVKNKYRVTYDSEAGNVFQVHKLNGTTANFIQSKPGLYYLDMKSHATMLVNTVDDNKSRYNNNAYSKASLARKIQIMIGCPSTRDFIRIVENGLLPNCPINRDDIRAAENIFGPDIGSLKGKTVRTTPGQVRPSLLSIPAEIMSQCKELTLCADIMFVNKIPFLVTLSRQIKFGTAEVLTS